ncbi:FAD-binding oxidoreductase [Microbacterium flavum]|nr:FAD-binding oxidoreductase [Microbacterium flavum]
MPGSPSTPDASAARSPAERLSLPEQPTPRPGMAWDLWGDGSQGAHLPRGARTIAKTLLKGTPHPVPRRDPRSVAVSPSRLSAGDLAALSAVGDVDLDVADDIRRLHLGGKSTPDLLRRRLEDRATAPDAILFPGGHDAVLAILRTCAERGIAVVPFGGGTSVVGGVEPEAGGFGRVVAVDLSRTAALLDLDEVSLLATFGAGTTGPQAEELLGRRGLTLGHFPQSFEYASLGGFAATRSSGQASRGYGRFDDLVHALRVATPAGELALGVAPASAAGPDLRALILGSEGAFGIITEVTVRVRPIPAHTAYGAWTFPDFAAGEGALRELTQAGIRPTVLRLSDEAETKVNAALGGHLLRLGGALAVATFEADGAGEAERVREETAAVFARHGARSRGEDPARSWERGRFASPALRDSLLDIGVLAETLETAATWSRLAALKSAVTEALTTTLAAHGTAPVIMCHISHVYPSGASLYFTVVAALTEDPLAQWADAKAAASRAITAAGGTVTHHHAVGRDHRDALEPEIGGLGVEVLRAVARTLDPQGIMNPGVLLPPSAPAS